MVLASPESMGGKSGSERDVVMVVPSSCCVMVPTKQKGIGHQGTISIIDTFGYGMYQRGRRIGKSPLYLQRPSKRTSGAIKLEKIPEAKARAKAIFGKRILRKDFEVLNQEVARERTGSILILERLY